MWKCSNCGEICTSAYCDRCGLPKEESVFGEVEETESLTDEEVLEEIARKSVEAEDDRIVETENSNIEEEVYEAEEYGGDEDLYLEDAYVEPDELIESKRAKSKKEVRAEEKREKRVAELEDRLKKAKTGQQQVPVTYKYEVKLKRLKKTFAVTVTVVVAVCVVLLAVLGLTMGSKLGKMKAEDADQKGKISNLESQNREMIIRLNSLEAENAELLELKESVRILESDGTYHMYGCDEIDSGLIWIYGKEQVVGNSRYIKCEKCN